MSQFAIGDIHGQLDKLNSLIRVLPSDADLIFLGDYLDKGADSRKVIDYLIGLSRERSCRFLIGNHEFVWLEQIASGGRAEFIRKFGGQETLQSYGKPNMDLDDNESLKKMFGDHLEFLKNLEPFVITDHAVCVHGGIDPAFGDDDLSKHDLEKLVFLRFRRAARKAGWQGKKIVCGHDIIGSNPQVNGLTINIDTGAWLEEGRLTALEISSLDFIQDNGTVSSVSI